MGTVSDNLSKAIVSSDLFADYSSPTFVRWHYKTANTPYKAGLTYGQEGFALVFGSVSGWHTVISWLKGGRNMWAHYVSAGTDYGWSEYAQKSDLATTIETLPQVSVQANGKTDWLTYTPKKEGYTPLGIVGYAVGTNDGITMNQIYLMNGVISYALKNSASTAQTTIPRAYVLWMKS